MSITVRLTVSGKVQGVFYRASTKKKAEELRINGWVKNTPSGDVALMASGNAEAIAKLIEWCRTGPPSAEVTNVKIEEIPFQSFDSFAILR